MKMFHALADLRLVDMYYDIVKPKYPQFATLNVLISYTYFGNQLPVLERLKREEKIDSTFLDAGTYGMNPDGGNPGLVNLFHEYVAWVIRIGVHFDYIASFDDRFNEPEHNRMNYDDLKLALQRHDESHGTTLVSKLVPVIHTPDSDDSAAMTPAEEFLSYIEAGATTIGLGSKPALSKSSMEKIKALKNAHHVRVHRFGNFDTKFIIKYEIASADSGRYFRSTQWGRDAWFWDTSKNELVKLPLRGEKALPPEFLAVVREVFGWDQNTLLAKVENIWMVNLFAHQQAQQFLTEKFAL